MENLLRFKKDQRYLIFDTESNGLNLAKSLPYQLSWAIADGGNVVEQHDLFIFWEDFSMSKEAAEITRFDHAKYKSLARPRNEVVDIFSKYFNDSKTIIVAQNVLNFDIYMLKALWSGVGKKLDYDFLYRTIDTKILAMAITKGYKVPETKGKDDFICWQYKVNAAVERGLKCSQEFLLKHYDIPHDKNRLHEALYDVTMLYEIFKRQMWDIELPELV